MIERKNESTCGSAIIVRIDPDLEDLIPGYLQNRRNDIVALTDKNDKGDFESIRSMAHKIKGSGGGYGFYGITEIAGRIEESAQAMSREAVARSIGELADYLERLRVIYE